LVQLRIAPQNPKTPCTKVCSIRQNDMHILKC